MPQTHQEHIPVMLREVIDALAPRDSGIYIDGTFGRGGYSRAILNTSATTNVIGIDRDPDAITAGQAMIREFGPRLRLLHGTFGDMQNLLTAQGLSQVDGITFDLGVSSPQIDKAERGFSFQEDGPLDMRMSREGQSAATLVNTASETDLATIIYKYGDERFSRRIAHRIIEARQEAPIERTTQLASLIRSVVPRSKDGVDPATRSFQALRIAVNDELGELERGLKAAEVFLKPEGRLAVVSFHSLEDRCVKAFLRDRSESAPRGSRHTPTKGLPVKPTFCLMTRKPQVPSATEIEANPRSRSARLRVAQRTNVTIPTENAA
ncbi:MAG: 16S rRNA (cytosine(1402)-N(4))-methyltransferase RsmH [Alphaproteobacteria bacterium]|nr:16S rRNA (cytosine(1402)-N(4))-methyltransferase RsmH [Alphaproteobacteria bacterium]